MKTLKDIPSAPNEDDYTVHSRYYRDVNLRNEAIKHIKEFRKPCNINILDKDCGHLNVDVFKNNRAACCSCGSIIEHKRKMSKQDEPEVTWIKTFFNIEEEDLI